MKNVAIIGFGFCGIISFHHLIKKISSSKSFSKAQKIKIIIFEKDGKNALGSAFFGFNKKNKKG